MLMTFYSLQEQLQSLATRVTSLEKEVVRLRAKVREARTIASPVPVSTSSPVPKPAIYNGKTKEQLMELIVNETKVQRAVKTLLLAQFSEAYIANHSITGRASNNNTPAKPQMDIKAISVIRAIIKEKFPGPEANDLAINLKIQNIVKGFRSRGENSQNDQ